MLNGTDSYIHKECVPLIQVQCMHTFMVQCQTFNGAGQQQSAQNLPSLPLYWWEG